MLNNEPVQVAPFTQYFPITILVSLCTLKLGGFQAISIQHFSGLSFSFLSVLAVSYAPSTVLQWSHTLLPVTLVEIVMWALVLTSQLAVVCSEMGTQLSSSPLMLSDRGSHFLHRRYSLHLILLHLPVRNALLGTKESVLTQRSICKVVLQREEAKFLTQSFANDWLKRHERYCWTANSLLKI